MEFAKYYNATKNLNDLLEGRKLFSYQKNYCEGIYICKDTHDFWVCRLIKDLNKDYENETGKWLIERNKIDKYEFIDYIKEKDNKKIKIDNRMDMDFYIDKCLNSYYIMNKLILLDDENGLENWDCEDFESYEDAIDAIDGGFGII